MDDKHNDSLQEEIVRLKSLFCSPEEGIEDSPKWRDYRELLCSFFANIKCST